jgi:hypothetical protein
MQLLKIRRDESAMKNPASQSFQTRAAVRVAIFDALEQLPEPYTKDLYDQKCELVYQHVYEVYAGANQLLKLCNDNVLPLTLIPRQILKGAKMSTCLL